MSSITYYETQNYYVRVFTAPKQNFVSFFDRNMQSISHFSSLFSYEIKFNLWYILTTSFFSHKLNTSWKYENL